MLFCSGLAFGARTEAPAKSPFTYYVDSIQGMDTNPGTSLDRPWRSLEKINATTFQPGDSILLKAGSTWEGQLWPKGSGKDGKPIHLGKYGEGAKPQIRGNGRVEDAVLLKNQEYWEIEDLEISNSGVSKSTRRGVHLAVENFGDAHHIVVRKITVHDVSGRDDVKDNGGIIFTSVGDKKPSRFIDILIENNDIYHVDRNGISSWSDRWQRSLWYPSLRVVVRGNKLSDIGGDGIMIAVTDGALLERNAVGHANQRSEGFNIAIWTWSADNSVIQFNEAFETKGQRDGEGFDSDWNSRNTIFQYNYSHDNDGGFLLICDDGGQSHTDSVGNIGTIARYNISQNDRHRGITLSGPVRDTQIYNNTIYIGDKRSSDVVLFTDWDGWPDRTAFYNNIWFAQGEARIGHAVARDKNDGAHTSAPGLGESKGSDFDSNVYFGVVLPPQDKHGLSLDPKFDAEGQGSLGRESLVGFGLQVGSPARASGRSVPENGGQDFAGKSLINCAKLDRGAVQSSGCSSQ